MTIVAPLLTFPKISWWSAILQGDKLLLDKGEHFQKMSGRNRYAICGANNPILLSVPLENGRNQRIPMSEVRIFNGERWQVQHWRTLMSVYKRSPFFDYFEDDLHLLYQHRFEFLTDFNRAGIDWVMRQLKVKLLIEESTDYIKIYPDGFTDIRDEKLIPESTVKYQQIFEDRLGFLPDLSILDLLFSEGPGLVERLIG